MIQATQKMRTVCCRKRPGSSSWRLARGWLLAALLVMASPVHGAQAKWVEASSDHFVIYASQNPETLRNFAERLETFHAALASIYKRGAVKPSPSNRVTIYVVPGAWKVRELLDLRNSFVGGVYVPNIGHPFAVVPTLSNKKSWLGNSTEMTLYHEYAHHFMWGLTSRAFPRWYVEGFAEVFGKVRLSADRIDLGVPAHDRKFDLIYARDVPIRQLLDYDGGLKEGRQSYNAFYGLAWGLFHYLLFDPARAGQLAQYEQLLAQGQSALQASEAAFGELAKLDRDLDRYLLSTSLRVLPIPRKDLPLGPIRIRELGPGESAMMPVKMRSRTGVDEKEAAEVVVDARQVAEKFPNDAAVLAALAEAEFDSGSDDAAIAAADRALALDAGQINAWIQKGYALSRKAEAGAYAWKDVRSHWVKANKVENDNPIPLVRFYSSFLAEGVSPTQNAIRGIEWALALAPYNPELRWMVTQQMISDGRLEGAARIVRPLAYSPHPGKGTEQARELLADIEARIAGRTDDVEEAGQQP